MFHYFTRRFRAVLILIGVGLLVVGTVSTMTVAHAHKITSSSHAVPLPSRSKPAGKTPAPRFVVNGGGTGQYARGATSMSYCNGNLYTAWSGSDDHINVAWGFSIPFGQVNGSFSDQVTYADTTYSNLTISSYTRPVLACWKPASGPYSDATRLWIAFTGVNKVLYLGYLDPADENQPFESIRIHAHYDVNQTSKLSPAIATQGGTLRIGWVGSGVPYIYFESTDNGSSYYSPNSWKQETSSGGLGMVVWCSGGCKLWFAWPGTDSAIHINVGYFSFTGGNWVATAAPTADFTCNYCDLTLVLQGSTLRLPYAGAGLYPDIDVDNSTDGYSWNNDQGDAGAIYGAGGAVDGANHFWINFPVYNSLGTDTLQIVIYQYN